MKDLKGNELGKGIIKIGDWYYKIFNINENQIVRSECCPCIETAKKANIFRSIKYNFNNIEQIEYESLGVFDSKGREYKVGDTAELWEGENVKILKSIKSINNNKENVVVYKDDACDGGWNYEIAEKCTILHSALEKPKDPKENFKGKLEEFAIELEKIVGRMKNE